MVNHNKKHLGAIIMQTIFLFMLFGQFHNSYAHSFKFSILKGKEIGMIKMQIYKSSYESIHILDEKHKKHIAEKLQKAGITTLTSKSAEAEAILNLWIYVSHIKESSEFLGYLHRNKPKYAVYLEMTLEEPAALISDPSVKVMATLWDSGGLYKTYANGQRQIPFISDSKHLFEDIDNKLMEIMDALIADLKQNNQ